MNNQSKQYNIVIYYIKFPGEKSFACNILIKEQKKH